LKSPQRGDVVLDEGDQHDHQRHREQRTDEVVRRLQRIGEPAEQAAADHRQKKELAERHHDARDGQRDEGDGVGPVGGPFQRGEALDDQAGVGVACPSAPFFQ
jgi:hypothetical protein